MNCLFYIIRTPVSGNTGWRPGRTVVLCSWDAEEYGLIGSSEWVQVMPLSHDCIHPYDQRYTTSLTCSIIRKCLEQTRLHT